MRVTGFGDYLIHFSPLGQERLYQADLMQMSFTGAEENVCAALGLWGEDVAFVTRLPDNVLAERAMGVLRSYGIDTAFVARGGKRMGVYYLETGASIRPSQVIYDRDHSAFTEATPADFDCEKIAAESDILYLSGITPALSDSLLACCLALCEAFSRQGKQVVLDVNYRPSLLSPERARDNLLALSPYITTLIGNEEHLKQLLSVSSAYGEEETAERLADITAQVRERLHTKRIAVTVRRTISSDETVICSSFSDAAGFAFAPPQRIRIVDRVGSGDAYSAGIVYSLLHGFDAQQTVDFAAASCALKHTVTGDINVSTLKEIDHHLTKGRHDVIR